MWIQSQVFVPKLPKYPFAHVLTHDEPCRKVDPLHDVQIALSEHVAQPPQSI